MRCDEHGPGRPGGYDTNAKSCSQTRHMTGQQVGALHASPVSSRDAAVSDMTKDRTRK
jgi:hypothetical protein